MATADDLDRASDSPWDWVAQQTRTYLRSHGSEGHENNGVRMLVLATTGRRSGSPRRTCLIYGTAGDEYVLVASNGGADRHPDWYLNLENDPDAGVQVGARRLTVRSRLATPAERPGLWDHMVAIFPLYADYAQTTSRPIPVVLLHPLDRPAP